MQEDGYEEEIAKLEKKFIAARAAEGRTASDDLRSAESKLAHKNKLREEARRELEAVAEAEKLLADRRRKAEAADLETQLQVDDAQVQLEECLRAVAHPLAGVHVGDA